MPVEIFTVDAFAAEAFCGNPATVCLLEGEFTAERNATWMQRVADELAQPATSFLTPSDEGYLLRWFTPTVELPLCGHGTVAAAHVLRERGDLPTGGRITFRTPAGPLGVREEDGLLWLALAAAELTEDDPPADVLDALGVPAASWFGRNGAEYVVVLETADQVERVRPNRERLLRLAVPRTVITALGGAGVDFTSRVFVPAWGLDEDQATGSAHAALAPLWARRLGRAQLKARQASRRGGTLALRLDADTVHIGADAVTVSRGSLLA